MILTKQKKNKCKYTEEGELTILGEWSPRFKS